MYRKIFPCLLLLLLLCLPALADEETFFVGYGGETKKAEVLSSGEAGVCVFLSPNEDTSLWRVYCVELAVFAEGSDNYTQNTAVGTKTVRCDENNNTGLNLNIGFGSADNYEYGVKYKLAVRYTYQSIADETIFAIAGEDTKDGWRLIGEEDPCKVSDEGLYFTLVNADFDLILDGIAFDRLQGYDSKTTYYSYYASAATLADKDYWVGKYAATTGDGIEVLLVSENIVNSGTYTLSNSKGTVIASGSLIDLFSARDLASPGNKDLADLLVKDALEIYGYDYDEKYKDVVVGCLGQFHYTTEGETLTLTVTAADNYGNQKSAKLTFNYDSTAPVVTDKPNYDEATPINDRRFYEHWEFSEDSAGKVPIKTNDVSEEYGGSQAVGYLSAWTSKTGQSSTTSKISEYIKDGSYTIDTDVNANVVKAELSVYVYDRACNPTVISTDTGGGLETTHWYDNEAPTGEITSASVSEKTWTNAEEFDFVTEFEDNYAMDYVAAISPELDIYKSTSDQTSSSGALTSNFNVTDTDTGKLTYRFSGYDISRPTDEENNSQDFDGNGLYSSATYELWIDRTAPTIYVGGSDGALVDGAIISVPTEFYLYSADLESSYGKDDASGVKKLEYSLSYDNTYSWVTVNNYSELQITSSGNATLAVRATDYAGNVTTDVYHLIGNNPATVSNFAIGSGYAFTVANKTTNASLPVYVVSPTTYSAGYTIDIDDTDEGQSYRLHAQLINVDDSSIRGAVQTFAFNNKGRESFILSYMADDGTKLPDGLYEVYVSLDEITDVWSDTTLTNQKVGEIAIKRSACDDWDYYTEGSRFYWKMNHASDNGLNRSYLLALEQDKYKTGTDAYAPYAGILYSGYYGYDITDSVTFTALHIDCAGNESVLTKHLDKPTGDTDGIEKSGGDAAESRSRLATTYYIGTRREQTTGVDNSKLTFAR